LLVCPFDGSIPDIFLESWVWENVQVIVKWLEKAGATVPQFMLCTKRPIQHRVIEEILDSKVRVIKATKDCWPLVQREMERNSPGAKEARSVQHEGLENIWDTFREDGAFNPDNLNRLESVVPGDIFYLCAF
jgi:hypothetical protein